MKLLKLINKLWGVYSDHVTEVFRHAEANEDMRMTKFVRKVTGIKSTKRSIQE